LIVFFKLNYSHAHQECQEFANKSIKKKIIVNIAEQIIHITANARSGQKKKRHANEPAFTQRFCFQFIDQQ